MLVICEAGIMAGIIVLQAITNSERAPKLFPMIDNWTIILPALPKVSSASFE